MLAQAPRSFSVSELGDVLFPDLDGEHARNRLHVYLHRLRQRLGRDVMTCDEKGYRLSATVDVDLWRVRAAAATKRRGLAAGRAENASFDSYESMSLAELDSLALRLRLPQDLVNVMREDIAHVSMLREH